MSLEDVISAAIAPASAAAAAAETAAETLAEVVPDPVEGAESDTETVVEDPPVVDPPEPVEKEGVTPPAAEVVPPVEPVDEFAVEHGIKSKDTAGRENRLPYNRVVKITENAVKKATTALEATHATVLTERDAKLTEYESRLEQIAEVERMMFEDQAGFLAKLKAIPGYEALLGPVKPAAPALSETEPGPDAEGGYSPDGLKALLAWHTAKATQTAAKEAEERIAKRYGPIEDRFKREEAEAEFEATTRPKIQATLKDARENWLGYKENEAEIQQAYLADKKLTLEAAYRKVVLPKMSADRAKMRTELLAELAAAPKGTAIVAGAPSSAAARAAAAADPNKAMDLEDTIRKSIAGLKR